MASSNESPDWILNAANSLSDVLDPSESENELVVDTYERQKTRFSDDEISTAFDPSLTIRASIKMGFFKQFAGITISVIIITIIPIIVYIIRPITICPEGSIKDYNWQEIEYYSRNSTVNFTLLVLVRIYRSFCSIVPYLWLYPSMLYLNQEHWHIFRILIVIYSIVLDTFTYSVIYLNHNLLNIPANFFIFFEGISQVVLIFSLSFLYGYNAARMILPILSFGFYCIVFGFVIYEQIKLMHSIGDTTYFAILYPWLITVYEALGLYMLDCNFNTVPSKTNLIKYCNYRLSWPWFCCCSDIPCVDKNRPRNRNEQRLESFMIQNTGCNDLHISLLNAYEYKQKSLVMHNVNVCKYWFFFWLDKLNAIYL